MPCTLPSRTIRRGAKTPRRLLALTLFATTLAGCTEQVSETEVLRPVRSQVVTISRGTRVRSFSGTARAGQEIDLSFRVPGRIERVAVEVGDTVQAGQLIAQLEKKDYEISERQAAARLAQSEARARNTRSNLDRIRGLYENDNASKNDLDAALAADQAARAEVDADLQAQESARRQLAHTSLKAPLSGAIASVPVEVNENVVQGQIVARMTSGSRPEVEVAIPGILIAQIQEGDPVTVRLDALPGAEFDAVVTEVGVAAGRTTTFPVTVRLNRPARDVRSGMAADVAFRFEAEHGEHLQVPSHAVGGDREGRFVYLLESGDEPGVAIVRRTAVEVGDLTHDGLEIVSGISEGQRVVTAGVRRLTDGQRVKLLDEESP